MSDRITSIRARRPYSGDNRPITGFSETGRKTRLEMIEVWRRHYQRQLDEAQRALAIPDEGLIVHTYVGVWAQKGRTEVTE